MLSLEQWKEVDEKIALLVKKQPLAVHNKCWDGDGIETTEILKYYGFGIFCLTKGYNSTIAKLKAILIKKFRKDYIIALTALSISDQFDCVTINFEFSPQPIREDEKYR